MRRKERGYLFATMYEGYSCENRIGHIFGPAATAPLHFVSKSLSNEVLAQKEGTQDV